MIILIKLFLSHIIGDFFLQPQKWVKDKEKKKLKSPKLYLHILIHFILLCIFLWDLTLWPIIVAVIISHYFIDGIKLIYQKKKTKRLWFFVDQTLHILSIITIYFIYFRSDISIENYMSDEVILLITCVLFLTFPVSIIMKTIFLKWDLSSLTVGNESLADAGKYIGILERVLVFTFVVLNHWEAVGFLITAKSVFRFGDLKESKQRKLTEYVLIGTLISFGVAIFTGLLFIAFRFI